MFVVSPQITPFEFGDESINADDMAVVMCTVTKGDLPLEISWTHDGYAIGPGVAITKTSKRISQLSIETVQASHAGRYTCSARNKAGEATFTALLNVNGDLVPRIAPHGLLAPFSSVFF